MAKNKKTGAKAPARRNVIAQDLRTPKYRPRVVRDRTKDAHRKRKHKNRLE